MASDYFTHSRPEVRRLVSRVEPILDVGCGAGLLCADLSKEGLLVVGVEPHVQAAAQARRVYADVHVGPFDTFKSPRQFRQVVFADVLEHMSDPWSALVRTREDLLLPGGRVIASIPNVRHWTVVRDLVVRGRWAYTDAGLLDKTHLRFFTRHEAVALLSGAGFVVELVVPHFERRLVRLLDLCTFGSIQGFLALQWLIVARTPANV